MPDDFSDDIQNVITAIHSKNWQYVIRHLIILNHREQFTLLNSLDPDTLRKLHVLLFDRTNYLQKILYETEYFEATCVIILRNKDKYNKN